jgi:hypothetical protein
VSWQGEQQRAWQAEPKASCNAPLRRVQVYRKAWQLGLPAPWETTQFPPETSYSVPLPRAQRCRSPLVLAASCSGPSPHVRVCTKTLGEAMQLVLFARYFVPGLESKRSRREEQREAGSCCFSIQRPHRHDTHHSGMHVVEKVTVERPISWRICGKVEVNKAAG